MRRRKKKKYLVRKVLSLALMVVTIFGVGKMLKVWHGQVDASYSSQKPFSVKETIPEDDGYIKLQGEKPSSGEGNLILVRAEMPFVGRETELVNVTDYKKDEKPSVLLMPETAKAFAQMIAEYQKKYTIPKVFILSGYRNIFEQERLLKNKAEEIGLEEANRWVATPGESEHHTGLGIDLGAEILGTAKGFTGEGEQRWFSENAHRFGFIERYTAEKFDRTGIYAEAWHYRYVGEPHAELIRYFGFCLEEYIDYIRQFRFGDIHLETMEHEIYYIAAGEEIYIPKQAKYEISGDNGGGYIITVKKGSTL